ncbi:hypothetical protein PR048_015526 [Dryococelus australis]|uniref:Uncharacterized protein n=1 Tax=Dryococelus australis TaxID=614101 RepID=A0ABQ9HHF5_9NEOP|nr:hypothetical protein PR048_015526 [Dryococelus australis]
MRTIEVSMEQRRNEGARETGDPREDPPTNGFVRHDSYMRKSGMTRPGIEPGSPWWEASRLTAQPPWPLERHSARRPDRRPRTYVIALLEGGRERAVALNNGTRHSSPPLHSSSRQSAVFSSSEPHPHPSALP